VGDECTRKEIAKQGGIQLIIGAMRSFADNTMVQYVGCCVLREMSLDDEIKVLIADNKGGDAVVAAMGHADLDLAGCQILYNLAQVAGNRALLAAQTLQVLVSVIDSRQESDGKRQFFGMGVISLIASSKENLPMIVKAGCARAVVTAMRRYHADILIQCAACENMEKLSHNDESKRSILESGAVGVIIDTMSLHKPDGRVQEMALLALAALTNQDRQVVDLVNRLGGISAICNAKNEHPDNCLVQREFCNIFFNLTLSSVDQLNELPKISPSKRGRSTSVGDDKRRVKAAKVSP
jgi:hypothetical protein